VQGVRRPSKVLDSMNAGGRLRDYCCKECIGSKTQITRGYLKVFRKECELGSFWKLEFTSEISGGLEPLNCSKGRRRSKLSHKSLRS
jgi:hypothetical protein